MKSKFVPKPLPHEINMLIAESEIECPQNSGHMDGSSLSVEDDDDEDNRRWESKFDTIDLVGR